MLEKKRTIKINIKLVVGNMAPDGYNAQAGIELVIAENSPLREAIDRLKLPQKEALAFVIRGEKAVPEVILKDGDEIVGFIPSPADLQEKPE